MDNTQQSDINYLNKRLKLAVQENDLLRKENQTLRKEVSQFKQTFMSIITDPRAKTAQPSQQRFQNEGALRQVLEMQRTKLDSMEKELEQYKQKYEKVLFQDKSLPYSQVQLNEQSMKELYDLRNKNAQLEEQLKQVISNHAKELATYRSKIAQQDAHILSSSQSFRSDSSQLQPLKDYQILNVKIKKHY
ncbi:hypothetical protein pb186bvf_011160 [Paramecium bursaria]